MNRELKGGRTHKVNRDEKRISVWGGVWQFVKFVLVGFSNTLISEGVYVVLIYFRMHYIAASFIGFSLSVVNAYYWNNKYVFNDVNGVKSAWWKVFGKTYIAYFWGYLVNVALLALWIDFIGIGKFMFPLGDWFVQRGMEGLDAQFWGNLVAEGINLIITVPMNFVINKYWAFKKG